MPMPRKADPVKLCATCGSQLERKRFNGRLEDRSAFLRRRYCSRRCMAKGFVSDAPSDSALLKRATAFRGDSCEACGATENLHSHHIDGDRSNNSPANIQTLCGCCHATHHHHARRAGQMEAGRLESPELLGASRAA